MVVTSLQFIAVQRQIWIPFQKMLEGLKRKCSHASLSKQTLLFHVQILHYENLWNSLLSALKWILKLFADSLQLLLNFNCLPIQASRIQNSTKKAIWKSSTEKQICIAHPQCYPTMISSEQYEACRRWTKHHIMLFSCSRAFE